MHRNTTAVKSDTAPHCYRDAAVKIVTVPIHYSQAQAQMAVTQDEHVARVCTNTWCPLCSLDCWAHALELPAGVVAAGECEGVTAAVVCVIVQQAASDLITAQHSTAQHKGLVAVAALCAYALKVAVQAGCGGKCCMAQACCYTAQASALLSQPRTCRASSLSAAAMLVLPLPLCP